MVGKLGRRASGLREVVTSQASNASTSWKTLRGKRGEGDFGGHSTADRAAGAAAYEGQPLLQDEVLTVPRTHHLTTGATALYLI